MGTPRQAAAPRLAQTRGGNAALVRRRFLRPLEGVSYGLVLSVLMIGLISIPVANAGAASSVKSNEPYAQAQLLKQSNLPPGWTKSDKVWVGTSADDNSSSMLTMTQFPDISTCLGEPPPLSVIAAEASSPVFVSKDQTATVISVADVYAGASEAKTDFPPLKDHKFANCFLKVEGPGISDNEKNLWPAGASFGTPIASVSRQARYGDQSGFVDVQVPVTLPNGQGNTDDFLVVLVIRQGRSTAELLIDQAVTTPSAALVTSLAKAVTAKMKARPPGNTIIAA